MKAKLSLVTIAMMAFIFPYFVDAAAETITVDVDGTGYDVTYNTTENLTLNSITADTDAYSLFLEVDSPEGGTLEITFERAFFDSTFEGEDVEFFVLVDGFDELAYDGASTDATRTLTMSVPTGTEEIEIIGTKIGSESLDDFVVEEPEPAPPVEEPEPAPPVEEPEPAPPVEEPEPAPPVVDPTPTTPVQEPTPTPPVTEKPKMECGAGTVLKDGVCVLVPKEAAPSTGFMPQGTMNQLVIPAIFAFIVAFFVMVILWIIGRGRRKKKESEQNL